MVFAFLGSEAEFIEECTGFYCLGGLLELEGFGCAQAVVESVGLEGG